MCQLAVWLLVMFTRKHPNCLATLVSNLTLIRAISEKEFKFSNIRIKFDIN